jgi:hypothetical protein
MKDIVELHKNKRKIERKEKKKLEKLNYKRRWKRKG